MDPIMGMVIPFAFNFTPRGWMPCNGKLLSIANYSALFSLLGTTYGGDGITTFALPNLQGRVPLGYGQGLGLSDYQLGEADGVEQVTLLQAEIPAHNHALEVSTDPATTDNPSGNFLALTSGELSSGEGAVKVAAYNTLPNTLANAKSIGLAGGSQSHENRQPYLALNYCIAVEGIYPSRG